MADKRKAKPEVKGKGKMKGGTTTTIVEGDGQGRGEGGQSLAMPRNVVQEGLRITRECLESVCEVER